VLVTGNSVIARSLAAVDVRYAALFNDSIWKESIYEKSDNNTSIRFSQSIGRFISLTIVIIINIH